MTVRGRGEGSIRKLGDRWQVRISVGVVDGKRRQKSLYAKSRSEAVKLLVSARQQQASTPRTSHIGETVEQYLRRWLDYTSKTTRTGTHANYLGWCQRYIVPVIGRVRLADLTPEHADAFTTQATTAGLAPGTVHNIRVMFGGALNRAIKWQVPGVRNVVAMTAGPKVVRKEQHYLNPEQARQFLDALQGEPTEAFYTLALYGGLRLGEVQGVRWQDIDLTKQMLRVQRSYRDGVGLTDVKTAKSNRTVDLSEPMVLALKQHRKAQMEQQAEAGTLGIKWLNDWGLVFTREYGLPTDRNAIRRDYHRLLRKARLARIRFHDLRHSSAVLQLAAGTDVKTVSENLGHARVSTTLDLYAHVMPSTRRAGAEALAALLG
jgi:integrase